MGTSQVPVEYYFIAVGFGLVVFTYDELRKLIARKYQTVLLQELLGNTSLVGKKL